VAPPSPPVGEVGDDFQIPIRIQPRIVMTDVNDLPPLTSLPPIAFGSGSEEAVDEAGKQPAADPNSLTQEDSDTIVVEPSSHVYFRGRAA
jgi:hypothetical protein